MAWHTASMMRRQTPRKQ